MKPSGGSYPAARESTDDLDMRQTYHWSNDDLEEGFQPCRAFRDALCVAIAISETHVPDSSVTLTWTSTAPPRVSSAGKL